MTEARATERMKDQFVSLISHELRTPLSSILGYLELVLDDEEQHAHRRAAHVPRHRRAQRPPAAAPGRRPAVHRPGRGRPVHAAARGRRPGRRRPGRRGDRPGRPPSTGGVEVQRRRARRTASSSPGTPSGWVRRATTSSPTPSSSRRPAAGSRCRCGRPGGARRRRQRRRAARRRAGRPAGGQRHRHRHPRRRAGQAVHPLLPRLHRAAQRRPRRRSGPDHHQGHHAPPTAARSTCVSAEGQGTTFTLTLPDDSVVLRTAPRPGAVPLAARSRLRHDLRGPPPGARLGATSPGRLGLACQSPLHSCGFLAERWRGPAVRPPESSLSPGRPADTDTGRRT